MGALTITAFSVAIVNTLYILITTIRKCTLLHLICLAGGIFLILGDLLAINLFSDPTPSQSETIETATMIIATITSILSSYTLILVGTNFYQRYNFIKSLLLFAPIVATFFELGATMYNVVLMIVTGTSEPYDSVVHVNMYIATSAAVLSLIYATVPLFNIRRQLELVPERTAISIIRLFTILTFFLAHVILIFTMTMRGKYQDPEWRASDHLVLNGVFIVGLVPSPRGIVKKIKKRMLGVEEFDIGGDVRVSRAGKIIGSSPANMNDDLESGGILGVGMTEVPEEIGEQKAEWTNNELEITSGARVERSDSTGSSSTFTSANGLLPADS